MVSAALTSLPGSSSVVRGAVIAYAQDLKKSLLSVEDLSTVVDLETAEQKAVGARKLLDVDVAVSVTGSAGPSLSRTPGTMVIGVSTPKRNTGEGDADGG